LLALFAGIFLVPGAYSIEVGFSAEDGGDSVGIYNDYDVSNSVSIKEDAEAKFGNLEMADNRFVEGEGDIFLYQNLIGSGGYFGQSIIDGFEYSGRIENHAFLKPSTLCAQQLANMDGIYVYAGLGLQNKENSAYSQSEAVQGQLQTTQGISTGSVHAFQDTHINALFGEADSFAETLDKDGIEDRAAITQIWLTNGMLSTLQQADATSGVSQVSQEANLEAILGASDTRCWNNGASNWAGAANMGNFGTILKMQQQAGADGSNCDAHQQLTAETSNEQNSYAWGVSEARWSVDVDASLYDGAWLTNGVYAPNSVLSFTGDSHSDTQITQAMFRSDQTGSGDASGVAGYYWGIPSGDPHFLGITPVTGFSKTLSIATISGDQVQGNSIESDTIRDVQISAVI
jgi:hypothetical protein